MRSAELGPLRPSHPVVGQVIRAQSNVQFGRLTNRFHNRERQSRHTLDRSLHFLGQSLERIDVVAVDLDRDLRIDAGHHVTDQMVQRLIGFDIHSGHLFPESADDLIESLGSRLMSVRVQAQDVFAGINGHRVFIHFSATSSSHEMEDQPVGLIDGFLHHEEFRVDRYCRLI